MITQYRPAYYGNPRASTLSGLATDTKPTDVENGARYEEIDTGKTFCFDKENKAWYEMPQSGGGSSVSVEPITIAKNGVTTAPDGVAYSPITTDTYTQDGDKITITEDDGSKVVFTQGEAQAEKTVEITSNGAFTVEPDAGFAFVRRASGTVNVPGPDFSQVTATAADVLKGKKILDADGRVITGTIPIIAKEDITSSSGVVYLPKGYYTGGNYIPHNTYTFETFYFSGTPYSVTMLVFLAEYAKGSFGVPMYGVAVTNKERDFFCFCSAYFKSNGADSHLYITGSANIDGNKIQIDIDVGIDYSNPDSPVAKGMTVNSATAYGGQFDMASLITTDTIVFMTWMPVSD